MIKKNLRTFIITSVITILPMLIGLLLWGRLPVSIATHFNAHNEPDGWSSRAFVVFIIPLIMLALHIFCVLICSADPKYENISGKALMLIFWIAPIISIIVFCSIYAKALGASFNVGTASNLMVGIMFVIIGNYLPKCRQNYTVGIKVPWALNDEGNWNYTHRVGGWCYLTGGIIICILAFMRLNLGVFIILPLCAAIPIAASYLYYRRHVDFGK